MPTTFIGGSKGGGARDKRAIPFIFMQFSAKILPNDRFLLQIQELAPPSGKSSAGKFHCYEESPNSCNGCMNFIKENMEFSHLCERDSFSSKTATMEISTPGKSVVFSVLHQHLTIHITMDCIVITIVWRIAGVNAPIWYNATHYYANSSCLKKHRCDLTIIQIEWTKASCNNCHPML